MIDQSRFRQEAVARRDYLEYGHDYCNRKNFAPWLLAEDIKLIQ